MPKEHGQAKDMMSNQEEIAKWDQIPRGDYFYHAAPFERLESIRHYGLCTPVVHKLGKVYRTSDYPEEVNDRLFFWATENDCCWHAFFRTEKWGIPILVVRFGREVIANTCLYSDLAYQKDLYAIFTKEVSIPPDKIETCKHATFDSRQSRFRDLSWVPLSEAKNPTTKVTLSRLARTR